MGFQNVNFQNAQGIHPGWPLVIQSTPEYSVDMAANWRGHLKGLIKGSCPHFGSGPSGKCKPKCCITAQPFAMISVAKLGAS